MTMAAAAIDPADVLSELLQAEQGDVFAFIAGEADPYIGQKSAGLRRLLPAMVATERRREGELAALVDELGGTLRQATTSAEVQYMAYLSAAFVLPRLIDARQRSIVRYEQAIDAMPGAPAARVMSLLRAHLTELRQELDQLKAA